jgi:outer membrane receptor protein involved in Fe transport
MAGDGDRFGATLSSGYNSKRLSMTGELGIRQDTQKQTSVDDRLTPDAKGGFDALDQKTVADIIINSFSARGALDYDLTPRTRIGVETHGNYTFFRPNNFTTTVADGPSGALTDSFLRRLTVHQKRAQGELSANLRQKLGDDGDFALSLSHEEIVDPRVRTGHAFDEIPTGPDIFDQQRLDNHLHRTELKGDLTQPFADMSKLKLGFDVQYDDNAYRNRGFDGLALTPDAALTNLFQFRQTISAAYATYERPLGDLTVLAGLRVEDVDMDLDQATLGRKVSHDYLRAYPSLHLSWKLSDSQQLTASYSHRVQRPDPSEFNAFRFMLDPLNFRAGNPDLKPQQTQSYELGYAYRQTPLVLLATAFYRQNRDGVADVLRDLGGGVLLSERDNVAQSRSAGLELVASGKIASPLSYNLTATGAWTELDSLGPSFAPTRSLASVSGHGGLTWQVTPDDLLQVNGFLNGKRLTPQGYADPAFDLDVGYRRRIGGQLYFVATFQDVLATLHLSQANDTPILKERTKINFDSHQLRVGFTWAFGGGRPRDPGFEFQTGAGPQP